MTPYLSQLLTELFVLLNIAFLGIIWCMLTVIISIKQKRKGVEQDVQFQPQSSSDTVYDNRPFDRRI